MEFLSNDALSLLVENGTVDPACSCRGNGALFNARKFNEDATESGETRFERVAAGVTRTNIYLQYFIINCIVNRRAPAVEGEREREREGGSITTARV